MYYAIWTRWCSHAGCIRSFFEKSDSYHGTRSYSESWITSYNTCKLWFLTLELVLKAQIFDCSDILDCISDNIMNKNLHQPDISTSLAITRVKFTPDTIPNMRKNALIIAAVPAHFGSTKLQQYQKCAIREKKKDKARWIYCTKKGKVKIMVCRLRISSRGNTSSRSCLILDEGTIPQLPSL